MSILYKPVPAMPGEDFVDKTSRLNFQATCDFNASAGYLHINYDTLISGIIIQYTCQSSNGTIVSTLLHSKFLFMISMQLADTILCDVTVGVRRFTFDSDAEVCFFYGCFRDNVNFDIACYVNSTNVTTCRKGKVDCLDQNVSKIIFCRIETLQSSSVSTQSTSEHATVMPTITATASSNTTVSENSQSLSSSAESILMTGSQSLSSSPATTQANQQTNGIHMLQ